MRVATHQGPDAPTAGTTEANIARVDVQLPTALPSRLTTLQKACSERQFASNPAGCPPESDVGTAVAHTPALPTPLEGPGYLVSHGGAAFPDLDLVLQGDGVVVVLTGNTQIKHGTTFSHFDSVPDAPINSFELKLPERRFSALAAFGNLCALKKSVTTRKHVTVRSHGRTTHLVRSVTHAIATPLLMPTTIVGQNGAVLTQATKIAVIGCPKAPAASKRNTARRARHSTIRARVHR